MLPVPIGSALEGVLQNYNDTAEAELVRGAIQGAVGDLVQGTIRLPSNSATRECVLERIFNAAGELAGLDAFEPIARPPDFSATGPAEVCQEDVNWFADLFMREPLMCQACERVGYAPSSAKVGAAELLSVLKLAIATNTAAAPAKAATKRTTAGGQTQYDVKLGSKKFQLQVEGECLQLYSSGKAAADYSYENLSQWGEVSGHLLLNLLDDTQVKLKTPDAMEISKAMQAAAAALRKAQKASFFSTRAVEGAFAPAPAAPIDAGNMCTVVVSATVRESEAVASNKVGSLMKGSVVRVLEKRVLDNGKTRVRISKGWMSLESSAGKTMLEQADPSESENWIYEAAAARSPRRRSVDDSMTANVPSEFSLGVASTCSFANVIADLHAGKEYEVREDSKKLKMVVGTQGLQLKAGKKAHATYLYESMTEWGEQSGGQQGSMLQLNFEDGKVVKLKTDDAAEIATKMNNAARRLAKERKAGRVAAQKAAPPTLVMGDGEGSGSEEEDDFA
eukprot:SAG22_NODE_479_length_9968_cov_43.841524_4_plen_507_part_00